MASRHPVTVEFSAIELPVVKKTAIFHCESRNVFGSQNCTVKPESRADDPALQRADTHTHCHGRPVLPTQEKEPSKRIDPRHAATPPPPSNTPLFPFHLPQRKKKSTNVHTSSEEFRVHLWDTSWTLLPSRVPDQMIQARLYRWFRPGRV